MVLYLWCMVFRHLLFLTLLAFHSAKAQLYINGPIEVSNTVSYQGYRPKIVLVNDTVPLVSWNKNTSQGWYTSKMQYSPSPAFGTPSTIFPAGTSFYGGLIDGPDMLSVNDTVYNVTWGKTGSQNRIYLCRSFDGGNTFVDTNIVYTTIKRVEFPVIAQLSDGAIGIAFMRSETDESLPEILFTKSLDHGLNWSATLMVSALNPGMPCECCPLAISVINSTVAVSYRNNISNIRDFYTSVSFDHGNTFTTGIPIDTSMMFLTACPMNGISSCFYGDTLLAVFPTYIGSKYQLKISKTSLTDSVNTNEFLFPGTNNQMHPQLYASNDTLALVWQEANGASYDVFFAWKSATQDWISPINLTNATGHQYTPDVHYYKGVFHVVYYDGASTKPKYFRIGFSASTVGIEDIKQNEKRIYPNPFSSSLTLDLTGELMLFTNEGKFIVKGNAQAIKNRLENASGGSYYLVSDKGISYPIIKL